MTPADLKILIQEGEGTTLEFNVGLPSSFARELVALANTTCVNRKREQLVSGWRKHGRGDHTEF